MNDSNDMLSTLWAALRPWAESLGLLVIRLFMSHGLQRRNPTLADALRAHNLRTLGWFLPLLGVYLALPLAERIAGQPWVRPLLVTLLIFGIGMLLSGLTRVLEDMLADRMQMGVADN